MTDMLQITNNKYKPNFNNIHQQPPPESPVFVHSIVHEALANLRNLSESKGVKCMFFFFRWRDRILSVHGFMDVSLERRGHPNPKWIFCIVYIYIPGTQMTLVLIGKDQGSTNPGIYIYIWLLIL